MLIDLGCASEQTRSAFPNRLQLDGARLVEASVRYRAADEPDLDPTKIPDAD